MKTTRWFLLGGAAFAAGFVAEMKRESTSEANVFSSEQSVEAYSLDSRGDGVTDTLVVEETISADTTGDGVADTIENVTAVGTDLDGDGEVDIVETTVTTATDTNGDGEADVVEVERHIDSVAHESSPEEIPAEPGDTG